MRRAHDRGCLLEWAAMDNQKYQQEVKMALSVSDVRRAVVAAGGRCGRVTESKMFPGKRNLEVLDLKTGELLDKIWLDSLPN